MLGWWLALSFVVTSARAEVVDRILYVVGTRLVTWSDVGFETELAPHDRSMVPVLDDPAYPIEQRLVDFAILRELAGTTALYRPEDRDVRLRFEAVRASFEDDVAWRTFLDRWGLDELSLQAFLSSRMVVERYVVRNALYHSSGALPDAERYEGFIEEKRAQATVRRLP